MITFLIELIIIAFFGTMAVASLSLAPWVPTRKKDFGRICRLAEFKPGDVFYELGCGTGGVIFNAAKNYDIEAIGLEIALPLYCIAKVRQWLAQKKNVQIKLRSLFKEDLSKADVIFIFGMPKPMAVKLREKLLRELKPGAKVISYVFPIEGLTPVLVDKVPNEVAINVYKF